MDETAEEREQKLDTAYKHLAENLAKEKAEYAKKAEELETHYEHINLKTMEYEVAKDEKNATYAFFATFQFFSLAQTFRLAERMTAEFETLYKSDYISMKNSIRIEKQLPKRVALDLDGAIARYEKSLEGRLMAKEDKAMLTFFWNYFMGDQT